MGTYGDPTDYPDAGALAGTETLLVDDGVNTLSTTVQDIADLVDVSNASNLTTGTVADARIPSTIARDSEVTAAISALSSVYQPLDSDLTAIAALTTTSFGRGLLELANLAALQAVLGTGTPSASTYLRGDGSWTTPPTGTGDLLSTNNLSDLANAGTARTNLGLGTAATTAASAYDPAGSAAAAQAASQPLDSDLTAIAALTTTSYGRSLLEAANSGALRTLAGLAIGVDVQAYSAVLAATTASFLTADETKLDGIEAGADVTDATNVAAAGAVMEADTSTASMSFVVDEDNMVSDSATKVPTQQSVKAYVDANAGGTSLGLSYAISQSVFLP